ncbi:MAG: hypothetical protein Q8P15_03605 [Nanoarchaeota archaeon]|nr:hypothetical protein [Nanoarchaeota archaeon]
MVVKPSDLEKLTEEEQKILTEAENEIDENLQRNYKPLLRDDVCINLPRNIYFGDRVFNEIIRIYQKAGWKIKYESDQRDGNYMRFAPQNKELK